VSDRLRAFLAVQLPEAARACTGQAIEILRGVTPGGVRWTAPESQHLTLKFLGEIPEDRVDALVERANAKLAGLAPVELALGGFGAFPSAREARVLWLGVSRGAGALAKLARLREPARVEIERLAAPESVAWTATEVVLYESRLAPDGARHVPLAHLALGAGRDPSEEFAPES